MYIDDCLYGTTRIMESDIRDPINLGSSELVTINQLVDIVEEIAGVRLKRRYNLDAPKGVRGRNSDNTLILERLGWEPEHAARGRAGEDVRLDLRRAGGSSAPLVEPSPRPDARAAARARAP